MVGGCARLGGHKVVVIGTQKGRDTKENILRNFGSAHPEGYRKALRAKIKVIATEPAGADDAAQSFHQHRLIYQEKKETIADGLRTNLGAPNFALVQRYVDDVVTVSEEGIVAAMRTIWETMKIVVEPSGAVAYAAIIERKIDFRSKRVAIILTGGNVDLVALPWMPR